MVTRVNRLRGNIANDKTTRRRRRLSGFENVGILVSQNPQVPFGLGTLAAVRSLGRPILGPIPGRIYAEL